MMFVIFIDTKENDIQGEHCHIQGLCKQNGDLQSQLNISGDEHIVIEGNEFLCFYCLCKGRLVQEIHGMT